MKAWNSAQLQTTEPCFSTTEDSYFHTQLCYSVGPRSISEVMAGRGADKQSRLHIYCKYAQNAVAQNVHAHACAKENATLFVPSIQEETTNGLV